MLPSGTVVVGVHYGLLVVIKDTDSSLVADCEAMLVDVTAETCFIAQYNLPCLAFVLRTEEAAVASHGVKVTIGGRAEQWAVAVDRLPNILRPKDAHASEANR